MGRHSRKGPVPQGSGSGTNGAGPADATAPGGQRGGRTGSVSGGRRTPSEGPGPEEHGGPPAGTPPTGAPQVRGGHPEQREAGGGWGFGPASAPAPGPGPDAGVSGRRHGDGQGVPRDTAAQGRPRSPVTGAPLIPGPRREFIEVFDALDGPPAGAVSGISVGSTTAPAPKRRSALPERGVSGAGPGGGDGGDPSGGDGPDGDPSAGQPAKGGKGRTLTGIAAAAVVTVLVVVVAGQVADGGGGDDRAAIATEGAGSDAVPGGVRAEPSPLPVKAPVALTYEQLMVRQFPLAADLKGPDTFSAVPGSAAAPPAKGQKFRYRVDIEKGLGLDGELFAQAVQKTLNDDRSWAHNGAMTFERISTGTPDFVITLASPGTTALWCAKSGLDTTEDNVSCDSASTDRVMINAFRWAQGSATYGPKAMYSYRQMLINHEVGHRLGHNHVNCRTPGALAPVMQQQTKSLDIDGITCRPNPWVYPTN